MWPSSRYFPKGRSEAGRNKMKTAGGPPNSVLEHPRGSKVVQKPGVNVKVPAIEGMFKQAVTLRETGYTPVGPPVHCTEHTRRSRKPWPDLQSVINLLHQPTVLTVWVF